MPHNPAGASTEEINAITQIASVRIIKTSDAMGVVALNTAQTFETLQSFSAGLSASGATFSGVVTVNSQVVSTNARGWFL